MPGSPVRVALVGAGYIGRIHAKSIAEIARDHPGLVELAYIADVDYSRAKALAREYGGVPVEGLSSELARADLAIVATPTHTHRTVVERLASMGIGAFLVEKPLAGTLEDAAAIARSSGRLWITAGHSERFNPALEAAADAAARGLLETVDAIETRRVGPFTPRAASTDVIHDLAIHDFDIIMSLVGEAPESVNAAVLAGIVSDLPDYASVTIHFHGVASSTIVARLSPVKERLVRVYSGGRSIVELDFLQRTGRAIRATGPVELQAPQGLPIYREDLEAVRALAEGRDPPVPPSQALATLYLCEKALESASRGARVRVREDPDYHSYRGLIEEGIEGYRLVRDRLLSGAGAPWRPT